MKTPNGWKPAIVTELVNTPLSVIATYPFRRKRRECNKKTPEEARDTNKFAEVDRNITKTQEVPRRRYGGTARALLYVSYRSHYLEGRYRDMLCNTYLVVFLSSKVTLHESLDLTVRTKCPVIGSLMTNPFRPSVYC